jgi:outer membrane protein assembly factor BamB
LFWTVTDPTVLAVETLSDGDAMVTGLERGTAYAIATVEEGWSDSAEVEVVRPGDLRWIAEAGGGNLNHTALDAQGRIYVATGGEPGLPLAGMLHAVQPDGTVAFAEPTCYGFYTPSVLPDGTAYTTGIDCSMAHRPDGSVLWSLPFGGIEHALSVAADGSVALLHNIDSETAGFAVLSWIAPSGQEIWRDTLGVTRTGLIQENPVAIAANGDVYVPWQQDYADDHDWLSRVSPQGTTLWTVPLGGTRGLEGQTPAPAGDRVYVSYSEGLAAYDTAGALLWEDATLSFGTSSPILDGSGNVFIQTSDALKSYAPDGTVRWAADSLSFDCGLTSATPTLLEEAQLVVPCGLLTEQELCAVDAGSGALIWRTALDARPRCGSPAVAADGTIYVTLVVSEVRRLAALWNDVPPLGVGWPTEGGDMGRTRSR